MDLNGSRIQLPSPKWRTIALLLAIGAFLVLAALSWRTSSQYQVEAETRSERGAQITREHVAQLALLTRITDLLAIGTLPQDQRMRVLEIMQPTVARDLRELAEQANDRENRRRPPRGDPSGGVNR